MIRRAALGAGVVAMVATLVPGAARAETAYRYWSYWTGGDQWSYSARGPGFRVPPDGGVEGWHFVVSPKDGSQATAPGVTSQFTQLCPTAGPAPEGRKRVAVVLDFGTPGIAPLGERTPARSISCLTVPASATGLQVLQEVAELRFHPSGLICGVAGFPAAECPGQSARPASASAQPTRPPAPAPVTVPTAAPAPIPRPGSRGDEGEPTATPSESAASSPTPYDRPSPVALPRGDTDPPPAQQGPPAWIAAIGAAMIAALLGLALLARRGRT